MRARHALLPVVLAAALGCGREGRRGVEVPASTAGDPSRGEIAIAKYGCGGCHVVPGVARATGLVGPPLTDYASRSYVAGRVPNTPDNLLAWIRRPDSLEPGTVMPALGVSEAEARDIVAYLYLETATRGLGPPHLLPAEWLERE